MGLIQRQSIKHSVVSVVGVIIGGLSVLFVYHQDRELYGILSFIKSMSNLLVPFLSLGVPALTVRYFPQFKNAQQKHQGFLGMLLLFAVVGISLSTALIFLLKNGIYTYLSALDFKINQINDYRFAIYGITIAIILAKIFTSYISNFGRVVVPNILNNLLLKIILPIIILLHVANYITISLAISLLVITYFIILIGLVSYTFVLKQWHIVPKFNKLTPPLAKDMFIFAAFSILSTTGGFIANQIDGIMISTLIDFENNGDYNIFLFMANTVNIAYMALVAIADPIVSDKIKSNDLDGITLIYQKTSLHALIAGILILIGVWCNMDDLLHIMNKFELYKPLAVTFLFLACSKLFDAATSVNTQIIAYSKYFRFNLVMVLILATLTIFTNYIFLAIFELGIIGAAMATCLSVFLFNLVKMLFIWWKFKMLPFTKETLIVLIIATLILVVGLYLPLYFHPLMNILIRSSIIVGAYGYAIYRFNVSIEVNNLILKYWNKLVK